MYITKNAYIFWKSTDTRKLELWKCLATGAFAVNVWALLSLQAEQWQGHSALQSLLVCPQWVSPTLRGPCSSIWECWKASRALRVSPMCVCSESLPSGCPVDFRSAVMGNPCKDSSPLPGLKMSPMPGSHVLCQPRSFTLVCYLCHPCFPSLSLRISEINTSIHEGGIRGWSK